MVDPNATTHNITPEEDAAFRSYLRRKQYMREYMRRYRQRMRPINADGAEPAGLGPLLDVPKVAAGEDVG